MLKLNLKDAVSLKDGIFAFMISISDILHELHFRASRSSGPGGQHVNKVSTRVTLFWDIKNSKFLDEDQRARLLNKLQSRINSEGVLQISSQSGRSQLANKENTINKLEELLTEAFAVRKKRKPTKPSKASIEKRLEQKRRQSEKKHWRKF
jgi:ribosome-associated protein